MTAVQPFEFYGEQLRTVEIGGEPWAVLTDLCSILGLSNSRAVAARLDDDVKGVSLIDTPGGRQNLTVVSEPGFYDVVVRSDSPKAKPFRRWATHEVFPAIRKTGSYSTTAAPTGAELLALAVVEAQQMLAAKDEQIAVLAPAADAWNTIASSEGDYSVADAAKMLARAGIATGRQRLFESLSELGWIYRSGGAWAAMQRAVDSGYLAEKPQSYMDHESGERHLAAPQVRVTLRGVERLRVRLGVLSAVAS